MQQLTVLLVSQQLQELVSRFLLAAGVEHQQGQHLQAQQ
jgi:hypothetical protein